MQTMKRPYDEHKSQIGLTHQVEDRNDYRNSLLFDFHKTIDPVEGTPPEEGFPEDSLEEEVSQVEEDSLEEEDTREEEEYHPEGHQEVVGDHHHYPCHKYIKESW